MVVLRIDGRDISAHTGMTVMEAAHAAGIYIPGLCSHPALPPSGACRLCIVRIEGVKGLPTACTTPVREGMVVTTKDEGLQQMRREILSLLMADHPHACLGCAQREGCTREPCSTNVAPEERCCPRLGNCELQKVVEYVGIREDTPKYLPKERRQDTEPLLHRDERLCILCGRCVRACSDLRGVGAIGFVTRSFELRVGTAFSRSLADADCRFCGACVEVCPTGALTDKDVAPGPKEEVLVPCRASCPAGVDVPLFLRFIAEGRHADACRVLRHALPLPGTIAYICPRPCEERCRRGKINEPVAIGDIQVFAAAHDDLSWKGGMPASTAKRIAVVGSGPAGLSGAYFLRLRGYGVTIFEREEKLGGMLRAIPSFKLPRDVLDREITILLDMGIEAVPGAEIEDPGDLIAQGYDTVLWATGAIAQQPRIEGMELPGVARALDILRDPGISPGQKTAVFGSGYEALEAARLVRRTGADTALLVPKDESLIPPKELRMAQEEGIRISTGLSITRIYRTDGMLRCILSSGEETEAHTLLIAQRSTCPEVKKAQKVFAVECGAAGKETSAVEAVASGRKAAEAIDRFLGGDGTIPALLSSEPQKQNIGRIRGFASLKRMDAESPPSARLAGAPDLQQMDEEHCAREAARCLRCDLRLLIPAPRLPPEAWLPLTLDAIASVPHAEGVYTLRDNEGKVLKIKGAPDLHVALEGELSSAAFFEFVLDKMYSKRESELLQQYVQKYGRMPEGAGDLDELF
ncbi:MAG: 2Fe-2S iron-sulfur cluster-binding protein [Candidatus Thermoplasmatota archaeon]